MRKLSSTSSANDKELNENCPLQYAMGLLNGKWKIVILWYIKENINRFSSLKKSIPSITDKMLSQQLRELENDGLIIRTIFPEIPPRVEYNLSDECKNLLPAFQKIYEWGVMQKSKQ
jgi:DNA-binding HxlR family transcriptional regulator